MSASTPKKTTPPPESEPSGILTTRAALILALGLLFGLATGILSYVHTPSVAGALLAGGAAFSASVISLPKLIRE